MLLPPDNTPRCLACQAHIDYADGLLQEVEQLNYRLRRAERENYRLRNGQQDEATRKSAKLTEETKQFLQTWHVRRTQFIKNARQVKIDPEGSRGKLYQKIRKRYTHDELMAALEGVFLSDFHITDKKFVEPSSFLRDDERIEKHASRFERAEQLRETGFTDEAFIRGMVQKAPDPILPAWEQKCPGCDRTLLEGCRCGGQSA